MLYLTQEPPAHPVPRPTPGPILPANPRRPCAKMRKRTKPLEALRSARTTLPRSLKIARTALRSPCRIRCGVRHGARCRIRPVPFFRLRRLSELGIPAPAPSALRLPFAPATPLASRHRLPPVPIVLSCSLPRATPSSGCLPPPASRSPAQPPPASSYERSLTLSARAAPTDHRGKAYRQRTSEYSLRVRLRRTRSKKKGERLRSPSSYDSRIGQTSTRHSRVSVSSPFPVTVSPNCFTAKTVMKKALTGMAR